MKSFYIPKASIAEAEEDTSRPKTKGKDKKETLMKVHMLFIKVENQLFMLSKVRNFQQKQHKVKDSKY